MKIQTFAYFKKKRLKKKSTLKTKKCSKVRDHCHYKDEYRGAAHSICNLNYSVLQEITVVFHNRSETRRS